MVFFDFWNASAAFIQSFFAWGTFNRDAFAQNVSMRQMQKYQKKNYNLSWITIARDDIRDMMSISVTRINNYMIVATLILGVAASAVTSIRFDPEAPDYVVYAFYLSIGLSIVFLTLTIMFSVKGQNSAFTNTMRLLTYKIRPENPADYNHDYMKQAQHIEALGPSQLFRIPGTKPAYCVEPNFGDGKDAKAQLAAAMAAAQAGYGKQGPTAEEATPLESLFQSSSYLWYLQKFSKYMKLWLPYDAFAKYTMGIGIIALGQGSAYFALGVLIADTHRTLAPWAAIVLTFAFMYLVVMATAQNFAPKNTASHVTVCVLLGAPALLLTVAATTKHSTVEAICVPVAYVCNIIFWLAVFLLSARTWGDTRLKFAPDGTLDFWESKTRQLDNDSLLGTTSVRRRKAGKETASSAANVLGRKDTYEVDGGVAAPHGHGGSFHWRGQNYVVGGDDGVESSALHAVGSNYPSNGYASQTHVARGAHGVHKGNGLAVGDCVDASHNDPSQHADYVASAYAAYAGVQPAEEGGCEDHWPTDSVDFEERIEDLETDTKMAVRQTLFLSALLWAVVFVWSLLKYVPISRNSVPSEVVDSMSSQAVVEELNVLWPQFFRPHAVACAADESIFLADRSRIYKGREGSGALEPVECDLNGTIADISSVCDSFTCWPLVLLQIDGFQAKVVNCAENVVWPLLQDPEPAHLLTGFGASMGGWPAQLFAARNGTVVQYVANHEDGWAPEWYIGQLSADAPLPGGRRRRVATTLKSLSTSGRRLLLFYGDPHDRAAEASAEARDVWTMARRGSWALPTGVAPIAGACALDGGAAALVLPTANSELGGPKPRLVRVRLPSVS